MGDEIFEMEGTLILLSCGVSKMEIYNKEGETWGGHMSGCNLWDEGDPQATVRWSNKMETCNMEGMTLELVFEKKNISTGQYILKLQKWMYELTQNL